METVLRSELLVGLGFRHGFSLRTGGVSAPPFDTLNLGRAVGDDPAAVEENHRRFAEAVGCAPGRLFEVSQVHGAEVVVVGPDADPDAVRATEADALVAPALPEMAVGVRVADCIPLLLADPVTGAVAAVHAGWRGTVARVVDRAIDALEREAGARARDLVAVIGPHIRVGAFEVGEDVAARIAAEAHGEDVVVRGAGKPHVDLARVVRAQLGARGVEGARIDDVGGCTQTDGERFFSYRRDGKRSGRHLAAICPRGQCP